MSQEMGMGVDSCKMVFPIVRAPWLVMGPLGGVVAVEIMDPRAQLVSPVWGWGYWEQ